MKSKKKSTENCHFYSLKNRCMLHGRVFVMFELLQATPQSKGRSADAYTCRLHCVSFSMGQVVL